MPHATRPIGDRQEVGVDHVAAAAQLHRVGVAEERRAAREPARAPVAEDHRGEADEAAAGRLTLAVEVEATGRGSRPPSPASPPEMRTAMNL